MAAPTMQVRAGATTAWYARFARALLAPLCVALVAGCATAPVQPPAAPPSAAAPAPDGALAQLEAQWSARHGAALSGFKLLDSNREALHARLALIAAAQRSLDLQYYVWFDDAVGRLLMAEVLKAADRGVQVRMLFDDLNTMLRTMSEPVLRDGALGRLDGHPNIEIRVFNAWRHRDWVGRVVEGGVEFDRLNRRMHNKQLVADNRAAIIGGRNIADEYFGWNEAFNFHDLDVLGAGPVARQASEVFDRYWNSAWVTPLGALVAAVPPGTPAVRPGAKDVVTADLDAASRALFNGLGERLLPGASAVHSDSPSRAEGGRHRMPEAFRSLMLSARSEVLISNAYIIPDARFIDDLAALRDRGVRVRILTNSLASHDVPAVNAHYEGWRVSILAAGAQLHEFRADAALRTSNIDTPPVSGRFASLHVKAMVIDRQRSFIGSMNLDPRSQTMNTEMGVVIDGAALAQALAQRLERDMTLQNSWAVAVGPDGELVWRHDSEQRRSQPARGFWQRVQNVLFKLMPVSYY
jgi:putative cardiolipin synthase